MWEQELVSSTTSPDGVVLRTAAWRRMARALRRRGGRRPVDRAVVGPHRARRAPHPDSFVIVDVAEDRGLVRCCPSESSTTSTRLWAAATCCSSRSPEGSAPTCSCGPTTTPTSSRSPKVWVGSRGCCPRTTGPGHVDSTYRFYQVVATAPFTDDHRRIALVGEAAHLLRRSAPGASTRASPMRSSPLVR